MNLRFVLLLLIFSALVCSGFAQIESVDATNNLVLPSDYVTSEIGALPQYTKKGKGKKSMILIPGLGFDHTVYTDFVKANSANYTMYTITIPGYGETKSPTMPAPGTSYGDQSWNTAALNGILKLIEKESLVKPVIVGHFTQGVQLALRLAIEQPNRFAGVIAIGGPAKFVSVQDGKAVSYPLEGTIGYVDKYLAPQFYKTINQNEFNKGNYLPKLYSLDSEQSKKLWEQVASNSLPVMIRYLCEFFASDITLRTQDILIPVLVLRPLFDSTLVSKPDDPNTNYIKYQFIDAWDPVAKANDRFRIVNIESSSVFTWKDQPKLTYSIIKSFVNQLDKY